MEGVYDAKVARLTLVKSVLATMPPHHSVVLGLNKKDHKNIDKILWGFLWAGRRTIDDGHYHVNWFKVCRPFILGGWAFLI